MPGRREAVAALELAAAERQHAVARHSENDGRLMAFGVTVLPGLHGSFETVLIAAQCVEHEPPLADGCVEVGLCSLPHRLWKYVRVD